MHTKYIVDQKIRTVLLLAGEDIVKLERHKWKIWGIMVMLYILTNI